MRRKTFRSVRNAYLRKRKPVVNHKGKVVRLTKKELDHACRTEVVANEQFGVDVDVTTLTTILKRISEQKFYEVKPSDYVPVRLGEGAWSESLLTYTDFSTSGKFSDGIVNIGSNDGRLASADVGVRTLRIDTAFWANQISWNIAELQQARLAGNWEPVERKAKSRKRRWDLGIQETTFLGLETGRVNVLGLFNQTNNEITTNTALITKAINSMTPDELNALIAGLIAIYRENSNYTAMPNIFVIPESDWNGLAKPSSAQFPLKVTIELLQEAFAKVTLNKDFKIIPSAYSIPGRSGGVLTTHRYALYNYDEESIRMHIPVDYTSTLANSTNNYSFQNVGYGQFTGVHVIRPKEIMYFEY